MRYVVGGGCPSVLWIYIYPSHLLQPVTPTDQKAKARAGPMEVKQVNHSECMCISGHVACGQMDGHID